MWLPMLLLAVMASGSACPDFCQCRSPIIECRDHPLNLTQLDELPLIFTELKVYNVDQDEFHPYVESVTNSKFLRHLQAIEVTNCSTLINHRYLEWDVTPGKNRDFPVFPNVKQFNISHNRFINLSGRRGADGNTANQLRIFDVAQNQVDSVLMMDSRHVPQLTWLSLASNNLDYIGPNNFKYLESLEYLDLSDNVLHTLEGIFDSLRSLQRLNVAGNKLEHVQANWFQTLGKLVELDISRNKLTFIPADTLQSLASLSVFKLAENPLIERDLSLLLGTGRRLEIVDASRIGLVRVPAALTHSVRTLKLAGNQLTSINSGDLDSYPLLRVLNLSNNRLMIIEDDALGRLDGLEELILSNNILPTIPKSLPSSLKIFDLKQNAISKLKVNDLQGMYLLKELNLSGNVISVIEGGSFRQLPALEKLDISDNPIKKLPSDTLSGPTNLVVLRMSGLMALETEKNQNQDTAFPILAPERLVTLDVSRSPALTAQLLADNAAISACKSLEELNLSYTKINAIRSDLAYMLPQLRILNLIGNEWNCRDDQFWLGEWLRQHETSMKYSTRCAVPINFEGRLLQKLPELSSNQITTPNTVTNTEKPKITLKNTELKNHTTIHEIIKKNQFKKLERLKNISESLAPVRLLKKSEGLNDNGVLAIISQKVMTTTPSSTQSTINVQTEETIEKSKSVILQSIRYENNEPLTTSNEEEWSNLSTASTPEVYTSTVTNYETTILSTEGTTPNSVQESNQEKESTTIAPNSEHIVSITMDNKKLTTDIPAITSTTSDTVKTTRNTVSTVSLRETRPTTGTTKPSFIKEHRSTLMNIEDSTYTKLSEVKSVKNIQNKKSVNRVISEFSRSKLLLANEEPRVNDEPNSFAEELSSQATESGARTSESLAAGAHPGMLVLLGAAIGAAAALTVVLSRRATVKRRDRQYHRHENIEVHALTPTTELW